MSSFHSCIHTHTHAYQLSLVYMPITQVCSFSLKVETSLTCGALCSHPYHTIHLI